MLTIKGIVSEMSRLMPGHIVERKGRTNSVDVYTKDRKLGIRTYFSRHELRRVDSSIYPWMVRLFTTSFNRATEARK